MVALHEFENGLDVGSCGESGDSLAAVAIVAEVGEGTSWLLVLLPLISTIPATGVRVFDG